MPKKSNKTKVLVSEKEFNKFYDDYHKLIYKIIRRYAGNPEFVADIGQEVFLYLAQNYYEIIELDNIITYLIVTVKRVTTRYKDIYTKNPYVELEGKLLVDEKSKKKKQPFPDISEYLTEEEYKIIYAVFYECRSLKDLAKEYNMSTRNFHYNYKKILKKLKPYLEDYNREYFKET